MRQIYPFPCCRCGFCCLSITCTVGQEYFEIGPHDPCPGLTFQGFESTCELVALGLITGIGAGCCIKARAIRGGVAYNFAALPRWLKQGIVANYRKRGIAPDYRRSA
jgi:hypothetical protein